MCAQPVNVLPGQWRRTSRSSGRCRRRARPRMFSQRSPAGRSWKPFRSLRSLAPSTGESTVTTRAAAPARAARSASASVTSIRGWRYIWNQTSGAASPAASREAATTSSTATVAAMLVIRIVPAAAAARAVARSPSGVMSWWKAVGDSSTGMLARLFSERGLQRPLSLPRSIRGSRLSRAKPASFARTVTSSRAPPPRSRSRPGSAAAGLLPRSRVE